jgi:uncharacterized surface protein with fasciclin (FAS1) repeats
MKRFLPLLLVGWLLLNSSGSLAWAQVPGSSFVTGNKYGNRVTSNLAGHVSGTVNRPLLTVWILQGGILATLAGQTNYTFFAPTEEALQKSKISDPEQMRLIMLHHIVPGKYSLDDLKDGVKLPTLAGDYITILRKKKQILISGVQVVSGNEVATNGVLHTINDVLKPKNLE